MGEKLPSDDYLARLQQTQDRLERLEAIGRRRLLTGPTAGIVTSSTTYVDLGQAISGARPGQRNQMLVRISAGAFFVPPGDDLFVSFRLVSGTLSLPSDDSRAFRVANGAGNADAIAVYGSFECETPDLVAASYDVFATARSANGGSVTVDGARITVEPI